MAERDEESPKPPKPDDAPSVGDFAAIGVGCLVVVIFFIAIVMVGMTRE